MNKTVTINISGIIFHIEEDAYDKLSKYLITIKGYFSNTDGGNEILSDIEARIAEILQEKISQVKQVVLMADVDLAIETMGKPEDFAGDSSQQTKSEQEHKSNFTFNEPVKKRLFRDPDHKAIGGVCSGIAAYFDVDMIWVRLVMFLLIFFGGISLWIYIILWIIIPEAKTTAEKLAMKGEKIDINNISKSVKEEAEQFKKRMEKYGNEINQNLESNSSNFFDKLGNFLKDFMLIFAKFFARLLGLILLVFGIIFMLGLMSSIFGFSIVGSNTEYNDWINIIFMERSHYTMGLIGVLLFFGMPVLMMIYGGIKLLFKIYYSNRWLNISAGILWLTGLIIVLFVGIKTGKDFSDLGKVKEEIFIETEKDTLYLSLNKNKAFSEALKLNEEVDIDYDRHGNTTRKYKRHSDYIISDKNKFILGYAHLNIVPSATGKYELMVIKTARGEDKKSAVKRAKNINYKINQNDNALLFDEVFSVTPNQKFRVQDVDIILKVPAGKVVFLDKSLENFIYDVENKTNTYDGDMVNRRWIMGSDGLECIDCSGIEIEEINEPVKVNKVKKIKIEAENKKADKASDNDD